MPEQPDASPGAERDLGAIRVALRDFSNAVQALQLYPPDSPVVGDAARRAHEQFEPHLEERGLSLTILPESIRIDSVDVEEGGRMVRVLAERLHQRGVACLHLEQSFGLDDLRQLAMLLATDADQLKNEGGIAAVCESRSVRGLTVELLQLERLFQGETGGEASDPDGEIWEQILGSFGADRGDGVADWHALAEEPDRLKDFLGWLLDAEEPPAGLTESSRVALVRSVCERVGAAADELGEDQVALVAEAVAEVYERLDPEAWIDLLGASMPIGADSPPPRHLDGATDAPDDGSVGAASTAGVVVNDLAQNIGAALNADQVEDLLVYALTSRDEGSPRIVGLFQRLLEGRSDRDIMQQAIRNAVERQSGDGSPGQSFEELWPRLTEALQDEAPDSYVSTTYRAGLDRLLTDDATASHWDLDRISVRMRELEPEYLVRRKVKVVLAVLATEKDVEDYVVLVKELERALPDLIVDGQYIAAEEVLAAMASDLAPSSGRNDDQREAARELLVRFCNQHTLRTVVRNLSGKTSTQIDAATRIFAALGPMAVPALLEALSDEESRAIRVHLVRMLAAIGDQALPEIRKHLRDKRWFFVRNLVWIIGEIGDPHFLPHLGIIVNHPDVRVRREAVRSMSKLSNQSAAKVLLGAVDDTDVNVSMLAIRGLGTSQAPDAVPRLRELVRLPNRTGKNTEVIRAAAVALGRIGEPSALEDLSRVARRPWLFRGKRAAATAAAVWAIATLQGQAAGDAPEARIPRERESDDGTPRAESPNRATGD